MFNQNVFNAILRHFYTAAGIGTAVLIAVGMSQGDATKLGEAVHQIGEGLASVAMGVTTLVGMASAAYAGWSATRKSQVAAVAAVPGTVVQIPDQQLADELPSHVIGPRQ